MNIKHPKKPLSYKLISDKIWNSLSLKEKDFVLFLHERKYTREQICRKLYIETDQGFRYLNDQVKRKINNTNGS